MQKTNRILPISKCSFFKQVEKVSRWSEHLSRFALLFNLDAFVAEFNAPSFQSDAYPLTFPPFSSYSIYTQLPGYAYKETVSSLLFISSIFSQLIQIFDYSMRFLAIFILVSCFVASEAFFGEDVFKGPGDFFSSVRYPISIRFPISKSLISFS